MVKPQSTSLSFLSGMPLSLISTLFFLFVFLIQNKKCRFPKNYYYHFFMIGFMVWITIANQNAEFPVLSAVKYDVAIKTIIFAYFIPFALITKNQIEFFIFIIVAAFSYFILIAGLKSLLGGGGYGINLVGSEGFMYAEGSTLATIAISIIPLLLYLRKYSSLVKEKPMIKYYCTFLRLCSLGVLIGTQARTGLVALFIFLVIQFFDSEKKLKYVIGSMLFGIVFLSIVNDSWFDRMSTIKEGSSTEVSALGRIVVWRWTIDYVNEKPLFGGGFLSYVANAGQLYRYQSEGEVAIDIDKPKAFHNIFFEVLGETGYGGLFFFSAIILHLFLLLKPRVENISKPLLFYGSKAVRNSLIVYCTGGLFLAIAFYPWIYYLYGCAIALSKIEDFDSR
jgi:putative inorganic carbon (HCO3(-)) transporter